MKAILSKSVIPAVLVIAALIAGTSLLAGYVDRPSQAPKTAAQANCDGCPLQGTEACPKTACADAEACPMPCCPKTGEAQAPCAAEKPETTGCPFMSASDQAATPCAASGCTQQK